MVANTNHLDGLPEPIPLKVLFGNSDKRMPRISPDGKYYGYLADDPNGVVNVFIKPVQWDVMTGELVDSEAQQITNESHRPLRFFQWAKSITRRRILYVQDTGGDENFHLHVAEFEVDEAHKLHNLQIRDVTPFGAVTVMPQSIILTARHPDAVVISLNKRDARFFDAYKVDLATGEIDMIMENPGDVGSWLVDLDLNVVGANAMNKDDGSKVLRVPSSPGASERKTIAHWPHGETADVRDVSEDGRGVYVLTSLRHSGVVRGDSTDGTNTTRLVLLSLDDGRELEVLAHDEQCDISTSAFNDETRTVEYVVFNYTKPRVEILNDASRDDLQRLLALSKGEFSLVSTSQDNQTWMYADGPDDASLKYYIYDRTTKRHALLFDSRPELAKHTLVKMEPHVIKTSDGEDMVVYLSLPLGVTPERLPFILNVHGGPWARDTWGYDPEHQHFANRGYGCLSVNFRASRGYGKRWMNLGDGQWGDTMQQDLTDAVEWIIKRGLADPERIAIFGGSYGGYAVLAGLAFTPEVYCCGVDIVGPSNVKTLLESIPPYWTAQKKGLLLRIGDVENDDELNRKISPLYHADKIIKPLMIAQGANDPRVKQAESDQIAKKLFENKHEIKYVLYKDEGHGFARPANRLDFTWRAEQFLASHLGGRALPKDEELVAGNSGVEIDAAAL